LPPRNEELVAPLYWGLKNQGPFICSVSQSYFCEGRHAAHFINVAEDRPSLESYQSTITRSPKAAQFFQVLNTLACQAGEGSVHGRRKDFSKIFLGVCQKWSNLFFPLN